VTTVMDQSREVYVYDDEVRKDILRLVPPDGRVIGSIGCGNAATEAELVRQGREVHGVDISAEAIAVARRRLTTARVVSPDDHTHYPPQSLDGLILADVIEHIPRAWEALAAFAQAVRPGGWVVISVPNMRYLDALWRLVVHGDWPEDSVGIFDATHVQVVTHRRLARWCRNAGLEVIQWSGKSERGWRENRWRRWLDRLTLRLFHDLFVFQIQVVCRKTGPDQDSRVLRANEGVRERC
jgi:2-polyprenyl-3-methyl-5-hydroxy-6-metoxy-1,4-benzoquinol methylase